MFASILLMSTTGIEQRLPRPGTAIADKIAYVFRWTLFRCMTLDPIPIVFDAYFWIAWYFVGLSFWQALFFVVLPKNLLDASCDKAAILPNCDFKDFLYEERLERHLAEGKAECVIRGQQSRKFWSVAEIKRIQQEMLARGQDPFRRRYRTPDGRIATIGPTVPDEVVRKLTKGL